MFDASRYPGDLKFHVWRNAAQTLTSGVHTDITWDRIEFANFPLAVAAGQTKLALPAGRWHFSGKIVYDQNGQEQFHYTYLRYTNWPATTDFRILGGAARSASSWGWDYLISATLDVDPNIGGIRVTAYQWNGAIAAGALSVGYNSHCFLTGWREGENSNIG